jgi:protein involved in polysaccharide export with SLBB domain
LSARTVFDIRNSALVALLTVCAAVSAAAQNATPAPVTPIADRDTIVSVGVMRPGDELNLQVYRDKELTGKYLIDSRGYVQIPGLGVIAVAGMSPAQATEALREQMIRRGTANPELAVYPLIRVSVLGEVVKPGLYSVDPGTSLIQLVTLVGGPTSQADLTHATVIREGRRVAVDLRSALEGSATGRLVLYSNDVLVVPRKNNFFSRENLGFALSSLSVALQIVSLAIVIRRT